jgi:hypothetical protein
MIEIRLVDGPCRGYNLHSPELAKVLWQDVVDGSGGRVAGVSSKFNLATIPALGAQRRITSSSNPSPTDPVEDHVQQPC